MQIPLIYPVIPHKLVQIQPSFFFDGIPGWPIGDTRRGFRRRRTDFPARLCGLASVCRARSVRQWEKIPDAVFSGGIAVPGRGCCEGDAHLTGAMLRLLAAEGSKICGAGCIFADDAGSGLLAQRPVSPRSPSAGLHPFPELPCPENPGGPEQGHCPVISFLSSCVSCTAGNTYDDNFVKRHDENSAFNISDLSISRRRYHTA